jgi:histidine ammonia-lyase
MATFAARKLGDIAENVTHILAIELLAAAQGADLRAPHLTSPRLQPVMQSIRADVEHYELDHYFAPDIVAVAKQVRSGKIAGFCPLQFASHGTV